MAKVIMYVSGFCPYCTMAEKLLRSRGVEEIDKIRVDLHPDQRTEMIKKTGRRTVPQIYIGETHIGGYDDLARLDQQGEVIKLLST
ncbi:MULTISPECIES: glutaredoxin 3 [Nitrosomonas]|jgi:glutaredoxin 3|uniref:Glutaredoxin n=1 Tax=Nitrosomonas communis TaxID=44574 RepID=A0A0F7KDT7_9PROT|nr:MULTISPECIES: glutaredoxin 3 [Nitrosomonas]AKH37686.1 glutaredoxin [Nitrosomonas communis]TYP80557.1 glutaredoxin 3 [Nitrosomonas communis]UVS62989.1 glutaredoxin 3 [Nitrosomonas sp. PLL12]SDW44707.1 glutaredoxin 3 [Nitrosomonas communis]SFI56454.1 glutaredoxin 3 [Nitrosomonas sp. Nm34]